MGTRRWLRGGRTASPEILIFQRWDAETPRTEMQADSVLVILGSARRDSHTLELVEAVLDGKPATRIDLQDFDIQQYEYDQPADRDDFIKVAEAMAAHSVIVFATPVYWYAMSGRMKVLFDRFTDLVTVR